MSRKHVYAACFVLHFLLVFLVSSRRACFVLAQGGTVLLRSWDARLSRANEIATSAMGENLERSNPLREGIALYTRCAGIETGYGFFAPRVAITRKLVFQIRYADGRVEYELPRVGGTATGVRLTLLFENIAHLEYRPLRETIFKMMAFSIWREHPDASVIRAVFGVVNLPSLSDFNSNKEPTYEVLYAYDFRFPALTEPVAP